MAASPGRTRSRRRSRAGPSTTRTGSRATRGRRARTTATATRSGTTRGMTMSTSTDGGLTWGPPRFPGGSGVGGQPVVQPNGNVIVPYEGGAGIRSFRSTDGGTTWQTVGPGRQRQRARRRREPAHFAAAFGRGGRTTARSTSPGRTAASARGCTSNDIVYSTSMDGRRLVGQPIRVPIDPTTSGVDHFIPGFAVDRSTSGSSTRLALGYYYYPVAACTAQHVPAARSASCPRPTAARRGRQPRKVAGPVTLTWIASTNQGVMVGDYMSTSFAGGNYAFPIFAVAKAKTGARSTSACTARGSTSRSSRGRSSARGTTASGSRSTTWCPTSSSLRSPRNDLRSGLTSGATWGRRGRARSIVGTAAGIPRITPLDACPTAN